MIWLGVLVLWMLTRRDLRRGVWQVLSTFFRPKLLSVVCGTAAYVFGLVLAGRILGLWTNALLGSTLWLLGGALVLVVRSTGVSKEREFMSKAFKRVIGVAALVAGFANVYVFPLVIS